MSRHRAAPALQGREAGATRPQYGRTVGSARSRVVLIVPVGPDVPGFVGRDGVAPERQRSCRYLTLILTVFENSAVLPVPE